MQHIVNQKATMVIMNAVGLVVVRHVTIKRIEHRAKYQNSTSKTLCVWFTEKGKRKTVGYSYEQVAIFEGWQGDAKIDNGQMVCSFNNKTYEQAKKGLRSLVVEHK